jgi:hypothetical protein
MNLRRYAADMHDRAQVLRADAMESAAHGGKASGTLHQSARTADDIANALRAVVGMFESMSDAELDARVDAVLRAAGGSLMEHAGNCQALTSLRAAMRRALIGEVHQ